MLQIKECLIVFNFKISKLKGKIMFEREFVLLK